VTSAQLYCAAILVALARTDLDAWIAVVSGAAEERRAREALASVEIDAAIVVTETPTGAVIVESVTAAPEIEVVHAAAETLRSERWAS
jgi:hypothetical protein